MILDNFLKYQIKTILFFWAIIVFSVGFAGEAHAAWYDASWGYRKPITITNNTNSVLANFQVAIPAIYVASMNANFSDVRFTDSNGTTLLSNWTEVVNNSVSSTLWVKVPSIPTDSVATIYMYYGNAGATTTSDIDTTFLFGDDFPGDSLNTSTKWSVKIGGFGGGATVSGGIMSLTTYVNGIDSKTYTLPGSTILEASVKIGNSATLGRALGAVTDNVANKPNVPSFFLPNEAAGIELSTAIAPPRIVAYSQGDQSSDSASIVIPPDYSAYHRYVIKYVESSQADYYYDSTSGTINTVGVIPPASRELHPAFQFNQANSGGDQGIFVDWMFVREYAATDPSVFIGAEEVNSQGVPEFKTWVLLITLIAGAGFAFNLKRQMDRSSLAT